MGNNEVLKQMSGIPESDPEVNLGFRSKVQGMLQDLEETMKAIRILLERFASNNDGSTDNQLKGQIASHFLRVTQIVVRTNHFFDLAIRAIKEEREDAGDGNFEDTKLRIANFLAVLLRRKFDISVKRMNRLQLDVSFEYQKKIERTLKIYKSDLSQKEIKALSGDPKLMEKFIQDYMMMSPQFEEAVRQIDERLSEIKDLERNMNKLLGLIKQLHEVVGQQSVVVDSITSTMDNIRDHSEKTFQEMDSAKQYQVSSKQKMFLLFVIFLVISIAFLNNILGCIIK